MSKFFSQFSMPSKNLESVYLKCAMPAKIDVATKFVTEEAGKRLVVNPETGRVNKDKDINKKKDCQRKITKKHR